MANEVLPITGQPRLRRELAFVAEQRSTRDPDRWPDPPRGDGRLALLIPGFLAGDGTLDRLAAWLSRGGYAVMRSGVRANVACMAPALERWKDGSTPPSPNTARARW